MKRFLITLIFTLGLGSLSAQSFTQLSKVNSLGSDSLRILAVMVEFKTDDDRTTFGTGKFGSIYTKDYGNTILDPLPHNAKYFEHHLEFAKNYYEKVSRGKQKISYKVIPNVVTVSKTMRNYSPPPKENEKLDSIGRFAQEVWQLVNSTYGDIDFSKYDLFAIFHAGVGREFNTPGSIGNERDIPSVYLGLNALQKIFGAAFQGFPVNGGKSFIINSMILPSTESREIESGAEKILLQLTTNGLLVSSIASHLGLPDLFNTETGTSAIGRLGLMDGESIFAYSGIFPPEPSAWEKIFLGWEQPVEINFQDKKLALTARNSALRSDTVIIKVPINAAEYYLIENRMRDSKKDGLNISYKLGDQSNNFFIDKDKGKFQWYLVDTLRGVITDVDEFDWAVPGNGIVIWHIDEKIIADKIFKNNINADSKMRGVDVEEADGIQDIGERFETILGEEYGRAFEEDLWYSGNPAKLYKNSFSAGTKPNSNANDGSSSLITIDNFSLPSSKMTFNVSFGVDNIRSVSNLNLNAESPKHLTIPINSTNEFMIVDGNKLKRYAFDGSGVEESLSFGTFPPSAGYLNGKKYIISAENDMLNIIDGEIGKAKYRQVKISKTISSPIVLNESEQDIVILAGTSDGYLFKLSVKEFESTGVSSAAFTKIADSKIIQVNEASNNRFSVITENSLVDSKMNKVFFTEKILQSAILNDLKRNLIVDVVLTANSKIHVIENGIIVKEISVGGGANVTSFALSADFTKGIPVVIISSGNLIESFYLSGAIADNFPILASNNEFFNSQTLASDLNGDSVPEIIATTTNGKIYVYDGISAKVLKPFPISIGQEIKVSPVIYRYTPAQAMSPTAQQGLAVIDKNNTLHNWVIGLTNDLFTWVSGYKNSSNNSVLSYSSSSISNQEYFPEDKAYNWPNPVYNGNTNIRFFVSENSDVTVKIFDLAGDLTAELTGKAVGGIDNELPWNVSNVQSGIYYAQVQVSSGNGNAAEKIIKIAVIK